MITHRDTIRLQDEGRILIIKNDILKGIERYILARRAGKDNFEYRDSVLGLEEGIERARRDYFENVGYLSSSANRAEVQGLRQTFLECQEQINVMDGVGEDDEGKDVGALLP